ncbi:uncharacterized protein LOC108631907 isoform X2 [Ceratina calcarata]|uniref:Uncharacterized protein LOC108631907 isoform X2 n=1 Tax=Ceratina calcarata TaxID=156304 RepID=A0AAJ7SDF7_9HYME|nr:uncharacterized protein LOC108631907 isoform X2 [Ceratina calcarata]XP_026675113.1 uncharacterized protein LOC108631907 isoform X2 [Ceratina calcarata]
MPDTTCRGKESIRRISKHCSRVCYEIYAFFCIFSFELLLRIHDLGENLIKQVVQRLRKEVETFKAENVNGAKVSIASLLGLNNNNHITNNNETKLKTGDNDFATRNSKEDYEEIVRNGDVPSLAQNPAPTKERPNSVETISGEDDVIEVSMDENSNEKSVKEEMEEVEEKECKVDSPEKIEFLISLGLITITTCTELQNKRAERKRRSTANPQFVYSSLEVPTKRKRHSYLQSGNVPQTRQTTARMNGPSPPPVKAVPPKSSLTTSRTVMKSLIPVQKSATRPNILRNVTESRVYSNKTKIENGASQMPVPTVKSVQSVGNKAVHIPGLPSSLTIERISSDSAVCISCRNPGTLTVCENCASNYHVSCHSVSPAPSRICPKCALIEEEEIDDGEEGEEEHEGGRPLFKKDEEFVAAAHASGIVRKTREDAEIYKTACGLHKVDATQKKRGFSSSIGISQLPSSTFLIPISSNSASAINQSDAGVTATVSEHRENSVPYSSIILNQLARPSIAYIERAEPQVSYAYQLPVTSVQSEKHQSYLIVKKITEPARGASQSSEDQSHARMLNYKLPITSGYNSPQTEISVANSSMLVGKQLLDGVGRNRKKQTNRAVPALNRIIDTENLSITAEYQLERSTFNGRKSRTRQPRNKYGINQLRSARATEILLPSYDSTEPDKQLQITKSTEPDEATLLGGRTKYRPRTGSFFHTLFSGHNKSYILTDSSRESRDLGAANKDSPTGRKQLHNQSYQLESGERSEPTVQVQRGALTKFFEHVKLEEAHIPAPPRAKLVYKSGTASERNELEVTEIADDDTNSNEYVNKTPPLSFGNFSDDVADQEVKQKNWLSKKIANKGQENPTTSAETLDSASNSTRSNDIIPYECDDDEDDNLLTDTFQADVTYTRRIETLTEIVSKNQEDRQDSPSVCNAQSNFLELRNEVSVPDDKADSERQDLSSGRRSTSSSSGNSASDSDTPEQAMEDSIKYSRGQLTENEYNERLGIRAVSSESMQVLEQYESAVLETGCSNAATC